MFLNERQHREEDRPRCQLAATVIFSPGRGAEAVTGVVAAEAAGFVSQLFKKASAYAEATCDRWYVLSAKHGLVHPDAVIEPYDMRLGTNERTSPPIHTWAAGVRDQLALELAGLEDVTLVALAGEQYRTVPLHSVWPYEVPMKGLGIGQQLGWLTARLSGALVDF